MLSRRSFFKIDLAATDSNDVVKPSDISSKSIETPETLEAPADTEQPAPAPEQPISFKTVAAPAVTLALAACGGGGGGSTPPPPPPAAVVRKPGTDAEAARFLMQAQLSASPAEIARLKDVGYISWLDSEIAKPISELATVVYDRQGGLGNGDVTRGEYFGRGAFLTTMWQQFIESSDAVRKRAAFALSEYFVVSIFVDGYWHAYGMCHYWDMLNKNAFGNFRTLLEDVTLNRMMGDYLSLRGSRKEDPRSGRRPDENYAREVMQLFTIGLVQLNLDGTVKTDSSGNPIPTYTNDDVTNIASAISGWDQAGTAADIRTTTPLVMPDYVKYPMTADPTKMLYTYAGKPSEHSTLEQKFLGVTIPANTDAVSAMKTVLDTLFNHPNTPPFFAKQMIQRLVTSNPSPAYVSRVANIFINNGQGVRGDLGAVFKAILIDDEALSASGLTSATFGKVREPMLRMVQWGRTFRLKTPPSGKYALGDTSQQSSALGQMVLMSPSVFNFFRPGYVPAGTAIASNKLVAPEFQIINEVSTIGYANYMHDRIMVRGNPDLEPDYSAEITIANDSTALVDRISLLLTANQLTQATKDKIKAAVDSITLPATNDTDARLNRVGTAILLTMVSPQYLIQK